jgi:poly(3-hydroxybutyrate) depolymerase
MHGLWVDGERRIAMPDIDLRTARSNDPAYAATFEKKDLDVGGIARAYYMYIGKPFVVANPIVFIFPPSGVDAETFAKDEGWISEADKNGNVLIFAQPGASGQWGLEGESDIAYWDALKGISDRRFKSHNTRQYICGYGDGAVMAQLAVLHTPEIPAGVAIVDPETVSLETLEKAGAQVSTEYNSYIDVLKDYETIYSRDVEQNVLIVAADESTVSALRGFWESVGGSSRIFAETMKGLPIIGTKESELVKPASKNPCAGVKVASHEVFKNATDLFEKFLNKTRRYRIAVNGELRAASDYRDNPNAKRYYEAFSDVMREWIEVLPSDYSKDKNYPLVIALHGSNNDGPQFYDITRLWEVAEERKFIVLFPTALRSKNAYEAWNFYSHTPKDNGNDDESFLLGLIRLYTEEKGADKSRVYLTGFSNGGGMTNWMAMNHPEVFAAVMPYSGSHKTPEYYAPYTQETPLVPYWMNRGQLEYKPASLSVVVAAKEQWQYWKERNGLPDIPDLMIETPRTITRIYTSGRVETRYTTRKLAHHAILSEQYWEIYDDFFSRFRRGEKGESIEDGYHHIVSVAGRNVCLSRSKRVDGKIMVNVAELRKALGDYEPEPDSVCMFDDEAYTEITTMGAICFSR